MAVSNVIYFEITNDPSILLAKIVADGALIYAAIDHDHETIAPSYLDFNSDFPAPAHKEGRVFYDNEANTLAYYNAEAEVTMQIGKELWVSVHNATGVTIPDGAAVTVTGITLGGVLEVGLAIASDRVSALNTIGIATHSIEPGTEGIATTAGTVNGVNTVAYTEGAAIWLSDSVPGGYQETRPKAPCYEVRMGGIEKSHATEGKIYAEVRIIDNDHDNNAYYNGSILEPNEVHIHCDGLTVQCEIHSLAANNRISAIIDQDYISILDNTIIELTVGTDSVPVENWVYIDNTGVISKSTSSFPTSAQYIPVARVVVPSAATAQTYGVYKSHAYTDHLQGTSGQGHLSHVNAWIRKRPAGWQNGVVLTQSVAEGVAAASIGLSYTSGVVAQLHDHTFPAYDTAIKPAAIVNSPIPYQQVNGISPAIDTDGQGVLIGNNKYYNLVVWGVMSEEDSACKIFFNLPSGSYTTESLAIDDVHDTASYVIPNEYKGAGFLITRLTIQRTNTTVTVIPGGTKDLRGAISSLGGVAILGGSGITYFDNLIDTPVNKTGQALKHVRVDATETTLEYFDPGYNTVAEINGGDSLDNQTDTVLGGSSLGY